MSFPLIDSDAALQEFCLSASQQKEIAVDTEFVWRSTFYPQFALLQIGWDAAHCVLIDTLAIQDKAPVCELMENASVRKIFHDAYNDIPIISRWAGSAVRNIGDTIIAAGFAGLTAKMSLARLLESQLKVVLPKTETQSDWLQRPLTEAQVAYAGDDVALLVKLHDTLLKRVEDAGNLELYEEEMLERGKPEYYAEMLPKEAWRRVTRPPYLHFTRQDYAVLCELAAWRERTAREQDRPRNSIFRDEWLVYAATKHPYKASDIEKIPGIWSKIAKKYGNEVSQVVSAAMKLQPQDWPDLRYPLYDKRTMKQRSDRIVALVNKRAEARSIDAVLFGGRRAAEELVLAANSGDGWKSTRLMTGWRYPLLTPAIDEIVSEYAKRKV